MGTRSNPGTGLAHALALFWAIPPLDASWQSLSTAAFVLDSPPPIHVLQAVWMVTWVAVVALNVDLGLAVGVVFSMMTVVCRTQRCAELYGEEMRGENRGTRLGWTGILTLAAS